MASQNADTHGAAAPSGENQPTAAAGATTDTAASRKAATGVESRLVTDFTEIYAAEYSEIMNAGTSVAREPSTDDGMTGLALSGGGIRSASFSLGVLQAFNATGLLAKFKYLSTVSGGGYIGTSMTVAMSDGTTTTDDTDRENHKAVFPFGKTGQDVGETESTRHLRDNSRYLLQNGIGSALSAFVIYLRGIVMNVIIILPLLLAAAAALALLTPTTRALSWRRSGRRSCPTPSARPDGRFQFSGPRSWSHCLWSTPSASRYPPFRRKGFARASPSSPRLS